MKISNLLNILLITGVLLMGAKSFSEETNKEKIETMSNETKDGTKKAYRYVKDKYCEMIDGKMKCVGKKMVNKAKDVTDEMKTKSTEIKNKVD